MADHYIYIYPAELQFNKANSSATEALSWDLNLSIYRGTFSTKIYDKRDYFDFDVVNVPFEKPFSLTKNNVYISS